jgi:hypothetical protein
MEGDTLQVRWGEYPKIQIVPEAKYPGVMWRVRYPDGTLSDMVNRTRAKDAARSILLGILNNRERLAEEGLDAFDDDDGHQGQLPHAIWDAPPAQPMGATGPAGY